MPQRRSIAFGSLFVAGLVVIAVSEYYPSSDMFAALGMEGPRANSGRLCGQPRRQEFLGSIRILVPLRTLICSRPFRWGNGLEREDVNLDVVSRELTHAGRMWPQRDSAEWQRERDSTAAAMARRGGHEFTCGQGNYMSHIRDTRYWRFRDFSVRLVAYKMEDVIADTPWWLQLDGYSELPVECTIDQWRYSRN